MESLYSNVNKALSELLVQPHAGKKRIVIFYTDLLSGVIRDITLTISSSNTDKIYIDGDLELLFYISAQVKKPSKNKENKPKRISLKTSELESFFDKFQEEFGDNIKILNIHSDNESERVYYTSSEVSDDCSICLEKMNSADVSCKLTCGHSFHCECITRWFKSKDCGNINNSCSCPLCRQSNIKSKFGNNKSNFGKINLKMVNAEIKFLKKLSSC